MRPPISTSTCPTTASRCGPPSRAIPRACCVVAPRRPLRGPASSATCPDLLRARRRPGVQRHPGDPGPAERRARPASESRPSRVEATLHQPRSPHRWTAFMKPGKRLRPGDRVALRRERRPRLPARRARRHGGGQGRGRRGHPGLRPLRARCWTRPSPSAASCPCRPTSPPSGPRTTATAPTTRPSTPQRGRLGRRARPRACTSRRSCSSGCDARGRLDATSSPCTSAPAPSCR